MHLVQDFTPFPDKMTSGGPYYQQLTLERCSTMSLEGSNVLIAELTPSNSSNIEHRTSNIEQHRTMMTDVDLEGGAVTSPPSLCHLPVPSSTHQVPDLPFRPTRIVHSAPLCSNDLNTSTYPPLSYTHSQTDNLYSHTCLPVTALLLLHLFNPMVSESQMYPLTAPNRMIDCGTSPTMFTVRQT